ncbi:flavin reductase family protein [Chelativorans sp. AA-79]|uniref:flavin reductase family protein n=1 Tax=Chelativorans sp. AA-79 TaxID=3028735 RepID=UPI0023F94E05|nr:flavin reductase family protein [Chelativorans sp. AA-79]WEX08703.1 flavin reductase family protein [Chelativorans sp. AA-79]
MFYEPKDGHGLPHDPFKAIVAPRPIGWISSIDADGRLNLAPYSFFNALAGNPPMVGFSSEGVKDSVTNVRATGEFVVNLATRPLAEAMNLTSARVPHGHSEFEMSGLTPVPSRLVKPPRVGESPAALECKITQSIDLLDLAGRPTGRWFTIGQVVGVHIDDRYLRSGLFDAAAARTIARCGYRDYAEVIEMFSMAPPQPAIV